MMIIMLGICIAGAIIFFSMWSYWISTPAPIVAMMSGEDEQKKINIAMTGVEIPISLSFIESSDFRTLAFNALPGDPQNNPTINANVGDKIIFDVINDGKSFHAFGVTSEKEGFSGIITDSKVATANNPLKPGEEGSSEFVPSEDGVYYYICTVPGHREQGMVGQIIVGDAVIPSDELEIKPQVTEPEPIQEIINEMQDIEFTGTVSIPTGSSIPGCEENNACFIPSMVLVSAGDTVTWSNDDFAAHTVTSGLPSEGSDGNFDSGLFLAKNTFSVTFDDTGEYPYYCIVHPWMTGTVTVN